MAMTRFGRSMADVQQMLLAYSNKGKVIKPIMIGGIPYVFSVKVVERLFSLLNSDDMPDSDVIPFLKELWAEGWDVAGDYSALLVPMAKGANILEDALFTVQMRAPTGVDWDGKLFCSGLMVLAGNKGAGKTYYLSQVMKLDVLIRWGETPEPVDLQPNVIFARSMVDAIGLMIVLAAMGLRAGLDSLRAMAYGLKGPAAAKGLSTRLFLELTNISTILSNVRAVAVATLNPLIEEDAMPLLVDAVAGSTMGVVYLKDQGTVVSEEYRGMKGRVIGTGTGADATSIIDAVAARRPGTDIAMDVVPVTEDRAALIRQAGGHVYDTLSEISDDDLRQGTHFVLRLGE